MAKILVADDNSNIQKMVGLVLKDQGIDVVAVGNGEAAVRKISDVRPDLVLADVFMPVRNGYEVCQYVKTDSALSHIPVILLVGAFDPLDEQEAQRVGADGVLKKPFVPPEPLISMVKSALSRAGVAHGGGRAEKTLEPEPLKAADFLAPRSEAVPTVGPTPLETTSPEEPAGALSPESLVDEVPARPEPLKFETGSQPVAFGSLLETPAEEAVEDASYVGPAHPELVPERDWRDPDLEEAEEEEEKPEATWRSQGADKEYAGTESSAASNDWRAGSFEQIQARRNQIEDWESAEEKPEAIESARKAQEVSPSAKETAGATPVIPEAQPVSMPGRPFAADASALVSTSASQEKTSSDTATNLEEVVRSASPEQATAGASVSSASEVASSEPEKKESKDSWFSIASNPWDAEIQKTNQLASAWDSGAAAPALPAAGEGAEKVLDAASETAKDTIEEAALPAAAVEAIREEAAQVAEEAAHEAAQQTSGETSFYAREEASEPAAPAPSMDDLVAKVLAKMSPDVLQAVTREILKPVVEAMVKEELKSKKS